MKSNPYQIAAFTQVARDGSFSRAAASLGVSQSSVTQHVAKLEAAMGTLLFIRRRDGVGMTQAARELFEVTDRLRTLEQTVAEKISSYADLTTGYLTIIANAPRPAMPLIAAFTRAYPQIQVDFRLYGWTRAMEMLRRREVDIAVITEPSALDEANVIELERTAYRALVRTDHALAGRDMVGLRDLAGDPLILPEPGSFTEHIVSRKTARHAVTFSRVIRTSTFPEVKEAILHGIGTGILLENAIYPSEQLVMVPIREMPEEYGHMLVVPADKRRLRVVQSFVDLAEADAPGPPR